MLCAGNLYAACWWWAAGSPHLCLLCVIKLALQCRSLCPDLRKLSLQLRLSGLDSILCTSSGTSLKVAGK